MPAARESLLDAALHGARRPALVRGADGRRRRRGRSLPADALQRVRQQGRPRPGARAARGRRAISPGVDRALAAPADAARAAGRRRRVDRRRRPATTPLVRALLTGCWSERLPSPTLRRCRRSSAVPAQRRADGPLPSPGDFVALVRDRAVAALVRRPARPSRTPPSWPGPASSSCGSRCPVSPRRPARGCRGPRTQRAARGSAAGRTPARDGAPAQWDEPDSCRPIDADDHQA